MEPPVQTDSTTDTRADRHEHRHRKKKHRRSSRWLKKAVFGLLVLCAWAVILYFWYAVTNDDSMRPPP